MAGKNFVAIEKGIKFVSTTAPGRYPWEQMDIDDCIRYPAPSAARAASERANEKYAPKKFRWGFDGEGVARVWRTA